MSWLQDWMTIKRSNVRKDSSFERGGIVGINERDFTSWKTSLAITSPLDERDISNRRQDQDMRLTDQFYQACHNDEPDRETQIDNVKKSND